MASSATTPFHQYNIEAATGDAERKGNGHTPIKLHLWALKFEVQIIYVCHEMLFLF